MLNSKTLPWVSALIVVLCLSGWAGAQQTEGGAPVTTQLASGPAGKLELDRSEFNFGEVWQGLPIEHEFAVKNSGPGPLTLEVLSSCGCTPVTKPKSPLAPGESTTFKISYDTTRAGEVQKHVTVNSSDPARPSVEIPVRGTVKPLYVLTPDHVTFDELDPDSAETRTARIESRYTAPLRMKLKPEQDFGRFAVELKEIRPGAEYELTIRTVPPLPVGGSGISVQLDTDLEKAAPIVVPVAALVPPRVAIVPYRLFIASNATQASQHVVRLQYRKADDVQVTATKAHPEDVKVEVLPPRPMTEGSRMMEIELRITVPPWEQLAAQGGQVEIFTNQTDPEFKRLVVAITKRPPTPKGRPRHPVSTSPATQPKP